MTVVGSASFFDAVAEEYASWYQARTPGGHAFRVRQQRVLELLDRPAGKVLDVGCGPGILARELVDLGYEVWGVDAAPAMIEQCHKQFIKTDRAHFSVGDATSLSFPDGFFDMVICTGVIGRIRGHHLALGEMARVIKRNGTLVVSFPNLLSPHLGWKIFVFDRVVRVLRSIYWSVVRNAQPPSLSMSFAKLDTAWTAEAQLASNGVEVTDIVYFYFNVFPSPLDQLFPRWSLRVTERMEQLRFGRLKWLGAGFLLKGRKKY